MDFANKFHWTWCSFSVVGSTLVHFRKFSFCALQIFQKCVPSEMQSYKVIFILCIIFMAQEDFPRMVRAVGEPSKCECGVFRFPTADKTTETPLVSKAPQFNFECNADGKASCSNMCVALAGASREEGPKKICELIENSDTPFVPVIYYKACEDEAWSYTGLKSTLEVCCKSKEVIPCA